MLTSLPVLYSLAGVGMFYSFHVPKYRDAQPPEVQEAFQFLLSTAMHEVGKFGLVSVAKVGGRWHHTFSGAGEAFSLVRPGMSKELERRVREMVRQILGEERLV